MMCTGEGQGTQVRVLVADWDRNHALSLAAAMHRAGLNTSTAFNGKEAIAKAGTFRPHFLITEAYLGRLSGIHAAARITAALPDCKVIVMSGEATFAGIANVAPEVVVYTCEQKPVDPIHLLEAITLMLSDEWPGGRSRTTERDTANPTARQPRIRTEQIAAASSNHLAGAIFLPALL